MASSMARKPLITISGNKILFRSDLNTKIGQDIPQEGIDWRRRLDSNSKLVYIDVEFVDFDIDQVERSSELLLRQKPIARPVTDTNNQTNHPATTSDIPSSHETEPSNNLSTSSATATATTTTITKTSNTPPTLDKTVDSVEQQHCDASQAFFTKKLLGQPVLHTYWVDRTDFEGSDHGKSQFLDWIGKVQASNCTEWAIIILEDGDFKTQIGTALFKSKLQSSTSHSSSNVSSSSLSVSSSFSSSTPSLLERMKKGLNIIFQNDANSDRWLSLMNQDKQTEKAQESYNQFIKKFRNIIMSAFSKQIELFEEQLRVQREMRNDRNWSFFNYFETQEELAFAFEFLTIFDEALVQYDLLDALTTEYLTSANFNIKDEPHYDQWTSFTNWRGLCLDLNCQHSMNLRKLIVEKRATLLDLRNYLFARQCDLMLMQNEPWRVAASASKFLLNCVLEHQLLGIKTVPGALSCWAFVSALEVLQKCECYSCTSTMENYSIHTVDIWNCARRKLVELGNLLGRTPGLNFDDTNIDHINTLLAGLGPDPHNGLSYQKNEISPQARLRDALAGPGQFSKHLIEISELTLGTYKHIGRKRYALLIGKELAELYMGEKNYTRALPFLIELERLLKVEKWENLLKDLQKYISICNQSINGSGGDETSQLQANQKAIEAS